MKIETLLFAFFIFFAQLSVAQIGRLPLSPKQTSKYNIGKTDITISYCRPSMRERTIFGGLVPYNKLWRTGANKNTSINFNQDVEFGGTLVKKGQYTIFTIPQENRWELQLYPFTDEYGIPTNYDAEKVIARISADSKETTNTRQVLSISIGDFTNFEFDLNIEWENTIVSFPIKLTNRKIMNGIIRNEMSGPTYDDYYAAATYQIEAGGEYEKGLKWINTAIELATPITWWDYRIKAMLLAKLNRKNEAKEFAEKGLVMAKKAQRNYGISEFQKILESL